MIIYTQIADAAAFDGEDPPLLILRFHLLPHLLPHRTGTDASPHVHDELDNPHKIIWQNGSTTVYGASKRFPKSVDGELERFQ